MNDKDKPITVPPTSRDIPPAPVDLSEEGPFKKALIATEKRKRRGRICLIADSPTLRQKIRRMLPEKYHVTFEYQDLPEILDVLASSRKIDIVILALDLKSSQGIETLDRVRGLFTNKRLLVYLHEQDIDLAIDCYLHGAIGVFFQRGAMLDSLENALDSALDGTLYIQKSVEDKIDEDLLESERRMRLTESRLSATEYKIMMQLREGRTFEEIAKSLSMTPASVRTKSSLIKKKLGITEALFWRLVVDCYIAKKSL